MAFFAQAADSSVKVGVYDSRVIAFAHFWSTETQRNISETIEQGKTAKSAGDERTAKACAAKMGELQRSLHLQVFSTAPATEAMASIQERLPALLKEAGVTHLISCWDEKALSPYPAHARVDMTERLLAQFPLPEGKKKMVDQIRKTKPLSLEEAKRLDAAGKL